MPERPVVQSRTMLLDVQRDHLRRAGQVSSVEELGGTHTGAGRGRENTPNQDAFVKIGVILLLISLTLLFCSFYFLLLNVQYNKI